MKKKHTPESQPQPEEAPEQQAPQPITGTVGVTIKLPTTQKEK